MDYIINSFFEYFSLVPDNMPLPVVFINEWAVLLFLEQFITNLTDFSSPWTHEHELELENSSSSVIKLNNADSVSHYSITPTFQLKEHVKTHLDSCLGEMSIIFSLYPCSSV